MTPMARVLNQFTGPVMLGSGPNAVQLGAGEVADDVNVDTQPIKGHIEAGRLVEVTDEYGRDTAPDEATEQTAAPTTKAAAKRAASSPQE